MSEITEVFLRDRHTNQEVAAVFIDALDTAQILETMAIWNPLIEEKRKEWIAAEMPQSQWPQHHHWNWELKAAHYFGLLAYQFFGIECEGKIQGISLVGTEGKACQLPNQQGKPLVYVHYIATAPWNDGSFTDAPRFGMIGSLFIAAAAQLSLESGFRGRVGLHSLPQADAFYGDSCGMTDLGPDASAHGLRYFEMTPEQADAYLHKF